MQGSEIVRTTTDFPKVYFFRDAEAGAPEGTPYADWEREFVRLGGIMGKALGEERADRVANVAYFDRYKRRNPDKLVLLHVNGNARDPRFERDSFGAGHWLYFEGCPVVDAVPPESGTTDVEVADASLFRKDVGRFDDRNEDIGLCALDPNGEPDWTRSEQVRLVAKDPERDVIRVKRGCYGTTPRAFGPGEGYAAAHVHGGPWGENANLLWFYNHATTCPTDTGGRTCSDVLVKDLASRFRRGGDLERFDGLEFDLLHHDLSYVADELLEGRGVDIDGDGQSDGGVVDGINVYGIGVYEFCRRLRREFGERRLLLADAHRPGYQRCFGVLNGIESEGFPHGTDPEVDDWSTAINRHRFWNANGRPPVFNYLNYKYYRGHEKPPGSNVPRLALAAAQIVDAAVFHNLAPAPAPDERIGIWDELRKGVERELGWLGRPEGEPIRLALKARDLLDGAGEALTPQFRDRIAAGDTAATIEPEDGTLRIEGANGDDSIRFRIREVPVDGPNLFVHLDVRAATRVGYPVDIARRVTLTAVPGPAGSAGEQSTWANPTWFDAGFYLRDLDPDLDTVDLVVEVEGDEPAWVAAITVHAAPDVRLRPFERGLVLANPARHDYTVDLRNATPDRQYRHLVGSPRQAPEINDGTPVEDTITLPALDGRFLVRTA